MQYELVRNANVEVVASADKKQHPIATIHVNDTYHHTFSAASRVSRHLDTMTAEELAERLSGGHFMFVENDLIDFRDRAYPGFVHEDDAIRALVKTIGISRKEDISTRLHDNMVTSNFILGAKWSDRPIVVPQYNDGGEFKSELLFGWSPFVATVNSVFMLWRLICDNGMRGLTRFLNTKIPLINRWKEHLDMANMQIQNKVDSMVKNRLGAMVHERATVAELCQVADYARARIGKTRERMEQLTTEQFETLQRLGNVADPVIHLSKVYRENVFTDSRLAAQLQGHLTTLDAYNIATEIRSHTPEIEGASTLAIDRFNNDLVFNRRDLTQHAAKYTAPRLSTFSNPDQAFFGVVH